MIDWEGLDLKQIKRMGWIYGDDDFFSFIDDLHEKILSTPVEQIKFEDNFEISLALLMLADGVLPAKAYPALADTFMKACEEIIAKKYTVKALDIKPPKSGRKSTTERDRTIVFQVGRLKLKGVCTDDSYASVASDYCLSKDTIRRIYERANESRREKGTKLLP